MLCAARQYSDQMYCGECGLTWDMNDPEPPECNPTRRRAERARDMAMAEIATIMGGLQTTDTEETTMGDTPETIELVEELTKACELLDKAVVNLLPGAANIVADVGLINKALCAGAEARKKAKAVLSEK